MLSMKSASFAMAIVAICIAACVALPPLPPNHEVTASIMAMSSEELLSAEISEPTWKSCSSENLFVVDKIALSPNPPVHGETLSITVYGTAKKEFDSGEVEVNAHIPFTRPTDINPCATKGACPVKKGVAKITVSQNLPDTILLKGEHTVNVKLFGPNKQVWTCMDVTLTID
eukprot:Nk52_evm45s1737 gene=Nk52_evmTU45s1737